ncbi:MAG: ectonucleotide pyrophosphatase/phosphodiesterase, partial [Gemmatimonadota bacterium]
MRFALLAPVVLVLACASTPPVDDEARGTDTGADRPYLVLVAFDGMRHDLVDRTATPAFDRVAARGARADGLIPAYPSKTFPNHYSIVTGLYPAHHGIVDNAFYDPHRNAVYRLGDTIAVRDGSWYGGEPIWVTAEKQGLRTASFYWVGSEAPIAGVRPTYFKAYRDDFPYEARVDTVLHWLSLPPAERPQLITLYFPEPDHTLHREGPAAEAVDRAVRRLDDVLGRLLDGLDRLPIADSVHLVLVSDHGMAPAPEDHVIVLDEVADLAGVRVITNTTQAFLYFDGDEARRRAVQRALQDHLAHATVYPREET